MSNIRVGFVASANFVLPVIDEVANSEHQLIGFITQPQKPSGRGLSLCPSPLLQDIYSKRVAVLKPTFFDQNTLQVITNWQLDVLVVMAYGRIFPFPMLTLARFGCVNLHTSLLPRWRGAAPIIRSIEAGDERGGVTLIKMDEKVDAGDIIASLDCEIDKQETTASLEAKLANLARVLLLRFLSSPKAMLESRTPQPSVGVSVARKVQKEEGRIAWKRHSASEIDRKIRAFNPWPHAFTMHDRKRLIIHAAQPVERGDIATGQVVATTKKCILVGCREHALQVLEVQPCGRRPMRATEYFRGYRGNCYEFD